MEMTVAMLGSSYPYAYAPTPGQALGLNVGPEDRFKIYKGMLGADEDNDSPIESIIKDMIKAGPAYINAIKGDSTQTDAMRQAALEAERRLSASWFDRNQSLVIAGGVLVLVAMVAVATTKKRRGRR